MEFKDVVLNRTSVRRFKERPVDHKTIEKILDVARHVPSWKNTQIVNYIVVESPEAKAKLATEEAVYGFKYNLKTLANAPAIVLETYEEGVCGYEKDGSFSTPKGDRWQMYDAGIAGVTFCLAAYDQGVGTVILGYFDEEAIRKIINLPQNQHIGAVICMGYPLNEGVASPRKEVKDLVTYL